MNQTSLLDGDAAYFPHFFSPAQADRLLCELLETVAWRQDQIKLFGRTMDIPRLTAWYGDPGTDYVYSGIRNVPLAWTKVLLEIKRAIEPASQATFNSVLINRYRTGKDGNAWHSDDEKEFGEEPVIASVSFGGSRVFQFRHKRDKSRKASLILEHGSLLIMRGASQRDWQHQIPKTAKEVSERINLTFRLVKFGVP